MSSKPPETAVPQWLEQARAAPHDSRFVAVDGCPIHYLRWGDQSHPGVMLIAGAGGHAHWFSHVAPLLADQFNVVAIDIGGCGDSGRRRDYSLERVGDEIMAVGADAGFFAADVRPVLVGHSAGGQFAVRTALAHGDALLGVIALDALRYARLPGDPAMGMREDRAVDPRPPRLYPDQASAAARFRLQPEPQVPVTLPGLLDHIARHSVRHVDTDQDADSGWTWKFDARLSSILSAGLDLRDRLRELTCHLAAIYGEHTHLADETVVAQMTAITQGRSSVFVMPGAGHYPMLDSPLAFVAAINGVVTSWVAAERAGILPANAHL